MSRRRPFFVSILAVIFVLLAAAGWLRFQQALSAWSLLASLGVWPGPLYLVLSGAAWGAPGLPAAWGLWLGRKWAARTAWIAAGFYPLSFWLDRLFIARGPGARTGEPFWLGVTLLWLVFVWLVLRTRYLRGGFAQPSSAPLSKKD
jgi:hypothetical protein